MCLSMLALRGEGSDSVSCMCWGDTGVFLRVALQGKD